MKTIYLPARLISNFLMRQIEYPGYGYTICTSMTRNKNWKTSTRVKTRCSNVDGIYKVILTVTSLTRRLKQILKPYASL